MPGNYMCYALESEDGRRSYVGCTNNMARRIRQHNGEICGGARYTRGGRPWAIFCTVRGFRTKSHALKFEWAWKYMSRGGGRAGRVRGLAKLLAKDRWTSTSPPAHDYPLEIFIDQACGLVSGPLYYAHVHTTDEEAYSPYAQDSADTSR